MHFFYELVELRTLENFKSVAVDVEHFIALYFCMA
jgi:hypothetical protein